MGNSPGLPLSYMVVSGSIRGWPICIRIKVLRNIKKKPPQNIGLSLGVRHLISHSGQVHLTMTHRLYFLPRLTSLWPVGAQARY